MLAASPGAGVVAGVVERGRLLRHQPGQLDLDVGLGERVGDGLVRADGLAEDGPLLGVRRSPAQREASEPGGERRGHDALEVEPGEQLLQSCVLVAHQVRRRQSRTSSRKTVNCSSGLTISIAMGWQSKPGALVGTTNRQGLSRPVRASWVRATISTWSDSSTPEI